VDRLTELLGRHVRFAYTAWDRIVLNGYLDRLQRPENISHFFREVVGAPSVTPEVLMSRTAPYRGWVSRYAQEHAIPFVPAAKGERKEDTAAPHDRRLTGEEGVACILSSVEQGRTFVSCTPRYPPSGGDPSDRLIHAARKRFLHDYFYVLDPVLGPMSLRVGTFLPFTVAVFLNGHSFLARELTRLGVGFRKDDNALLAVADVTALEAAAERLTPAVIEPRCAHWARQLAPRFSREERVAAALSDRYSVAQVELATDVIFRRSAPLRALFRRAAEVACCWAGRTAPRTCSAAASPAATPASCRPCSTGATRASRSCAPTTAARSSSSTRKGDRLLRTETCLNDTHDLGIGRRLEHLPELRERMRATNMRYLDAQAEVLASTVDAGALAALARPVRVGQRRVLGLKLEDDRVVRLLEALLHPGTFVADWTTREVHARVLARHRLAEAAYRLGQLRYDLGKLRAHGLVERIGTSRRYRLTPRGLKLGVLLVKLRTRLLGPLTSLAAAAQPRRSTRNPSAVEAAFRQVDAALDHLCHALGLQRAA
jgi:hypothetical protein